MNYFAIPGMMREKENAYSFQDLINKVAEAFEVSPGDLFKKCRHKRVKWARWCIWKIMYSRGYTKEECGRMVGNHDHTTVGNAFRKIDDDIVKERVIMEAWKKVEYLMGQYIHKHPKGLTIGEI